jgi:hypothetical protein
MEVTFKCVSNFAVIVSLRKIGSGILKKVGLGKTVIFSDEFPLFSDEFCVDGFFQLRHLSRGFVCKI